ncbi:protein maelstrom homolog [Chironomus tepperi]|uniref:protein maelstrom homolog n=1 Tax=Chironomus tepperi TaxID=113505 RepID=UPI00391F44A6
MPKKINAFAKYMFDIKEYNPHLSMAEVQSIAGEHWQNMSQEEREQYKSGDKPAKRVKVDLFDARQNVRYNCLGEPIDEVNRRQNEKRLKIQKDIEFIDNVIGLAIDDNSLLEQEFYFFSASYFIKKPQEDIFPAEIAIAKFSLFEGITDCFHMLINPGNLPMGFAATALQHSKNTHRLPIPPNIVGEQNYKRILDEILRFLDIKEFSSLYVPPFFVFDDFHIDDFEAAELTLQKITDENRCNNAFRLLKADQLLFLLNKHIVAHSKEEKIPLQSIVQTRDLMRRDPYAYRDIGCDLHNTDDNSKECTLSKVKRWGFSIIEHCGADCIERIPGQHMPISNFTMEDDFDDEETVESCLTESFHQLRVDTTNSQSDLDSIYSKHKASSVSSQLDLSIKQSIRFFNPMRSSTSIAGALKDDELFLNESQTNISRKQSLSNFNSMRSVATNIDDTVKGYEESWSKKLVQNNLDEE